EEGQTSIAWRGRDKAAEDQPSVGAEALDERAGFSVSILIAGPAPIRQVNVGEDYAEPGSCRWRRWIASSGYKELRLRDVAIDRAEEPLKTKRLEDGCVGRVVKGVRNAGEGGLYKPRSRCGEERAAIGEESVEWCSHSAGSYRPATVPVDLAATVGERPCRIAVVCRPES